MNLREYQFRMARRVGGYTIQRNGGKLTSKQVRRIKRKAGIWAKRNAR